MTTRVDRRHALKQLGGAGLGLVTAPVVLRAQAAPIVVAGQPVEITVSPISRFTVRITVTAVGSVTTRDDGALAQAAAVTVPVKRRRPFEPVRFGDLTVRFGSNPPTLRVEDRNSHVIQEIVLDPKGSAIRFSLGDGPLLGFGEGGPQFDRKGATYTNHNGQAGYRLRTHGGRVPIQWLVSTDGWGLFIHRPLGAFDLTGPSGVLTPADEMLPLDCFVTAASDPVTLMSEYARITGFAELPPLWSLGYMQSHRTLAGPDEINWVARTFREKKLPCDALIYLGTEFSPSGWNTRNGEFEWKAENFPDPKRFISDAHAQHYKIVLHIVIEGRRMDGTVDEPCTPEKAVPSGRSADDRWPDDRAVACYWPYHKPLFDIGVDGWWPDQGDGLDAASRLSRIRMYWDGSRKYRPNERPFALHRNGYAGMQRYGAFLWSGDVYSTWETLKTHVPVAINTGLSGIPFWGTDIGGFVPTAEYTGELHVRWFQFGTFCPSFRAHGRNWHLRLPWGWNMGTIPASELRDYANGAADPDPAELHNPLVEPIVRKYLELRYRLLPYTYTIARECADTGLPLIRALWLHYHDDPQAVRRGDQFLWGRDILVSPVVEKCVVSRRLYLPRGLWFDFWTEARLDGGQEIDRTVDLETMPLHVRAGAILPLGPIKQYVEDPAPGPLTVVVYPGVNGASSVYEDDGRTFDYKRGAWMKTELAWNDARRTLSVTLGPGSRMLPPARRIIEARVAGSKESRTLVFDGRPIETRF